MAEVLPEAERVLAAVQQVGADAAQRLASPAAPAAPVSSAVLGALHAVVVRENVAAGKPVRPRQRQRTWLISNPLAVDYKRSQPIFVVDYNDNIKAEASSSSQWHWQ